MKKTRRSHSLMLFRDVVEPYACTMRTLLWYNSMLLRRSDTWSERATRVRNENDACTT